MELFKATSPEHLEQLASHMAGKDIVDHNHHLDSGKHPEAVDFDQNIVFNPGINKPLKLSLANTQSTSPLQFYKSPKTGQKFLLKPYYEKMSSGTIGPVGYVRFPIQGWAEMANQALYHAGNIGHLTSKAHVQELETYYGKTPMIVVSMNPRVNKHVDDFNTYFGPYPHELYDDSVKMGIMDFLTNNNDRHSFNAMYHQPRGKNGIANSLLGIDHGRSFNYKRPNRFMLDFNHPVDSLYPYIAGGDYSANEELVRPDLDWSPWSNAHLQHGIDWWKNNRQKIRDEMANQLVGIKHDEVRNYIDKNFKFRTQAMDKFANAWDKNPEAFDYDPFVFPEAMRIHGVPMLPFLAPGMKKSEEDPEVDDLVKMTIKGNLGNFNFRRAKVYTDQAINNGAKVTTKNIGKLPDSFSKDNGGNYRTSPANGREIFHHALLANGTTQHLLSLSNNPNDYPLAYLNVEHYSPTSTPVTAISYSGENAGFGLGTRLYLEALKHHGSLQSDGTTSDSAEKLWAKLLKQPGVIGELAPRGTATQTHFAQWKP